MTLHVTPDSGPPTLTLQPGSRFVLEVAGVPEIADILDRDNLVKTLETVRRERDSARTSLSHYVDKVNECGALLDRAGIPTNGISQRLTALIAERADLARRLEVASLARDCLAQKLEEVRGELDDAIDERDALRPKPAGPVVEWRNRALFAPRYVGLYAGPCSNGRWFIHLNEATKAKFGVEHFAVDDEPTARAVLLALAGHDPGGRWTVAGHTVPVDVVRAVCGTVAVGWSP